MKTTHEILMESANLRAIHYDKKTEDTKSNFNNHRYKKWYSEEEVEKIFNKFDEYSCIKNDKWYLELKEHFLKTGELK